MAIQTVTTENFDRVVAASDRPVLVDFSAPWCVFCRRIAPVVEQLAAQRADTLAVGAIDIDEQPQLAERFSVMTIPTLLLFKNGQAGEPLIAPQSRMQIDAWLKDQGAL